MYYRELFKLCEWDDARIDKEKPRIEKAFERAGITPGDCKEAEGRIKEYFDMRASRKSMGLYLRRFIDLILSRDEYEKVVYQIHLGFPRLSLALSFADPRVYCDFIDCIFEVVMGPSCFNKLNHILEMAETHGMDAGLGHCGVTQTAVGAMASGILQKPDLFIGGGQQCDQAAKVVELIGETYDIPYLLFDTARDEPWGFYPQIDNDIVQYWGNSLQNLSRKAEEMLGITISEEVWRKARVKYAMMWSQLRTIYDLYIEAERCPVHLSNHSQVIFPLLDMSVSVSEEQPEILDLYAKEMKEKMDKGEGVLPKDAPRVALMCLPLVDPAVAQMYEEAGLYLVIPSNANWIASWELGTGHKYDHFTEKIAESYIKKGYVRCGWDHLYRANEMVKECRLDGYLWGWMWSCRAFSHVAYLVKDYIEKEAGVPVLPIEIDGFDPRDHTPEQLRTRVETFAQLLMARKAAAA